MSLFMCLLVTISLKSTYELSQSCQLVNHEPWTKRNQLTCEGNWNHQNFDKHYLLKFRVMIITFPCMWYVSEDLCEIHLIHVLFTDSVVRLPPFSPPPSQYDMSIQKSKALYCLFNGKVEITQQYIPCENDPLHAATFPVHFSWIFFVEFNFRM